MPGDWKRPESVEYPKVWSRFLGKREINGKIPKFWIQDIPEEMCADAAEFMCKNYVYEEPLSKYSKMIEDKASMEEAKEAWKTIAAKEKVALICLKENEDGEKPTIAGVNILSIKSKKEMYPEISGEKLKMIVNTCMALYDQKDTFELIGANEFLSALGMSVLPEFRGQGIGEQLLSARIPLCKAVGLKGTFTVFTSSASQKLAERVGFKDVVSIPYEDLPKLNPRFVYPGITEHTKNIRLMYKLV